MGHFTSKMEHGGVFLTADLFSVFGLQPYTKEGYKPSHSFEQTHIFVRDWAMNPQHLGYEKKQPASLVYQRIKMIILKDGHAKYKGKCLIIILEKKVLFIGGFYEMLSYSKVCWYTFTVVRSTIVNWDIMQKCESNIACDEFESLCEAKVIFTHRESEMTEYG